jgi:hypothetical protein
MNTTDVRRWIRIQRQRTDSGDLSHLTRRPHLSVRFQTFPARVKRYLGRPVQVYLEFGPAQLDSVRFVFIYFPAYFKYVSDMNFKLKFQEI